MTTPLLVALQTSDGLAGVFRDAGTHLVLAGQDTGAQRETVDPPTVHLLAFDGDTGLAYNSFVFGLAPRGATQVKLVGMDGLGAVENGVYVVAIKTKDVLPTQLNWVFSDAAGMVIAQGWNITQ